MKKLVAIGALVLAVLGWTGAGHARIGALDQVPAATLLLPYFEVDLDNPNGVTTLFSINNASDAAILAQVTLWSDLSVPTLGFAVYLTGYDVQTINLRDIFVNGVVPRTADAINDTFESENFGKGHPPTPLAISNQGAFSFDRSFPSCQDLPYPTFAELLAAHSGDPAFNYLLHLQQAHTGGQSPILGGLCAGRNLGDRVARGYVTVDTVNSCSLLTPASTGYFIDGGLGIASNQNVVWGDYFYVKPGEGFAQGNPLVHIEAAPGTGVNGVEFGYGSYPPGNPETQVAGEYTFYGRYVAWTAADNREPLATNFAARFLNGGVFTGGTDLVVWRDSKANQQPFPCPVIPGVRPPWFPMSQEAIVVFDEEENPQVIPSVPFAPQPPESLILPFPAESQKVRVNGPAFPVPFTFGWLYLNLNTAVAGNPNPPEDPAAAQAFVEVIHSASGRFSVGHDAVQLDSATNALHFVPGP